MKVDVNRFGKVLHSAAETINEAARESTHNPSAAIGYLPAVIKYFDELQSFGSLEDFSASITTEAEKQTVQNAIRTFLQTTKEAQEKVGAIGATLFSTPQFLELTDQLEQVKTSLERGKKVEGTEKGKEL